MPDTASHTLPQENEWKILNFKVGYEDNKQIKLLRIDARDRLYLENFSLIYLETGEDLTGKLLFIIILTIFIDYF